MDWLDSGDSFYSSTSSGSHWSFDDDELLDFDELEDCCVTGMKDLKILPVKKMRQRFGMICVVGSAPYQGTRVI